MEDNRRISICIPTYERVDMTIEAFMEVYADYRVGEILIVDDASNLDTFHQLREICEKFEKVKLLRNVTNVDCYANKKNAISFAKFPFCILLDSDNIIDRSYIDKLYEFDYWEAAVAYMPSFAKPTFNYKEFSNVLVTRENVNQYLERPFFSTMLNCMNYFVNRDEYLKVWDGGVDPHTADSIYQNYNWLKNGNKILIVDGLEYQHRIHNQSHYILNNHKTGNFYNEVVDKIKAL